MEGRAWRLRGTGKAGGRDLVTGELSVGGRTRSFTMRLPRSASGGIPLVLALHGNHPDVAFLRAVIDWSAERHGTWPDRTVVAGISNGAFMAHRLGLEASDQVAVLAAVAGGLPANLRDARPAHAVSAMLIHGTDDTISPIGGGYSRHRGPHGELRGRTLSLDETARYWRTVDRCPPGPGQTHTTEFSSRNTSDSGTVGTRVVAWTVFGGGHAWPGSPAAPGRAEPGVKEFDAAEEICRFAGPLLASADSRRL